MVFGMWENGSMLSGTPKYVAQSAPDSVLVAALCERELQEWQCFVKTKQKGLYLEMLNDSHDTEDAEPLQQTKLRSPNALTN